MSRVFLILFFVSVHCSGTAQNIGIGITAPLARLHVADSSVLFTAAYPLPAVTGNPPVSGSGARMMWYADRTAFRAGYAVNDSWDKPNVGEQSFAVGYGTVASGYQSAAMGVYSTASGASAIATGTSTIASGNNATAMGAGTRATGNNATALGSNTTASGIGATAMGTNTYATGIYSLSAGYDATASGSLSFAAGAGLESKAFASFAIGAYNDISDNPGGTALGSDRIFQLGNGANIAQRSNAITILRNGNIGIGNLNPARPVSFPPSLGEKILLYPGTNGEVGIGVYGNELRLHCDNPGSKVSLGTQDNAGNFTEAAKAQINGAYAFSIFGSLWVNGTTYASDERFKQHITSIASPLQKLTQINGVEYEMNTAAFPKYHFQPGRQIGLLAQNVEKIIPEAVKELDGYKGVDYARLVPLLIESVKEQQGQIEALKKELAQLKSSPVKK